MITQQQNNEIQQQAQAPAPVKEHLWIVVVFSILGVALPLVGGWWVNWPLVALNFPANDWVLPMLVQVFLPVAVGAFLLCFAFRLWWVAGFAGVAWIAGEFLAAVLRPLLEGGQPAPWPLGLEDQLGLIGLVLVPLFFAMMLGVACAYPFVKWRASHQ